MTPADMKLWRKALRLTQPQAAAALHIGLRTQQGYESGDLLIPGAVALGCVALLAATPHTTALDVDAAIFGSVPLAYTLGSEKETPLAAIDACAFVFIWTKNARFPEHDGLELIAANTLGRPIFLAQRTGDPAMGPFTFLHGGDVGTYGNEADALTAAEKAYCAWEMRRWPNDFSCAE